ncbi:unnamed protein product [Penicillium manginii]
MEGECTASITKGLETGCALYNKEKDCELCSCGTVAYCSTKHQREDRKNHSEICQSVKFIKQPSDPPKLL